MVAKIIEINPLIRTVERTVTQRENILLTSIKTQGSEITLETTLLVHSKNFHRKRSLG